MARWLAGPAVGGALLVGGLLLLVQTSSASGSDGRSACTSQYSSPKDSNPITKRLHDLMEAGRIGDNLRKCTSTTHVGGTPADLGQAEHIRDIWRQQQLDDVIINKYDVLLSHPNTSEPSRVYLLDGEGRVKFTSSLSEEIENEPEGELPAYLAFCPSGDIRTSELVYANYGRREDFRLLRELGVSVRGRVVIMRYGAMFRGNKIKNAQDEGAAGAILFSDPAEYGNPSNITDSYPGTFWLPDAGIQRGTVTWRDADPLTYGYPATEDAFRDRSVPPPNMPLGPCHTLSARDAHKVLSNMGGPEAPAAWRGALRTTYRLGPQLARPGWSLRLFVNNLERVLPTYNTLGFIRGSVEPDRYVILGNHRDSWSYGSLDPCSATATMMEMVRAFSLLKQSGWRPRRTLVFASWGSGEFGYYGATELVEEHITLIGGRTVAYLNVDLAIIYTYNLFVVATPLLQAITEEAAKQVAPPEPSLGFCSLYDHWRSREKGDLFSYNLGSPSEHWSFYQMLGTPIVYMMWEIDFERWSWVDYPLYHTPYETYEAMLLLDPTFSYHLSLGRLWAVLGQLLADRPLLPLDVRDVRKPLRLGLSQITAAHGDFVSAYNVSLDGLERAVAAYEDTAEQFHSRLHSGEIFSDIQLRQFNDQMVLVERSFVDPNGLLVDDQNRNAVFGTDPDHEYNGLLFPDVSETLAAAQEHPEDPERWRRVRRALASAVFVVNAASAALREPTRFARGWPGDVESVVDVGGGGRGGERCGKSVCHQEL